MLSSLFYYYSVHSGKQASCLHTLNHPRLPAEPDYPVYGLFFLSLFVATRI